MTFYLSVSLLKGCSPNFPGPASFVQIVRQHFLSLPCLCGCTWLALANELWTVSKGGMLTFGLELIITYLRPLRAPFLSIAMISKVPDSDHSVSPEWAQCGTDPLADWWQMCSMSVMETVSFLNHWDMGVICYSNINCPTSMNKLFLNKSLYLFSLFHHAI